MRWCRFIIFFQGYFRIREYNEGDWNSDGFLLYNSVPLSISPPAHLTYSTLNCKAVSHLSTDKVQRRLTMVIEREPAFQLYMVESHNHLCENNSENNSSKLILLALMPKKYFAAMSVDVERSNKIYAIFLSFVTGKN